jgi:hypothetical protein
MTQKVRSPYSGALAKPIVRTHGIGMLSYLFEGNKDIVRKMNEKIPLLFRHYKITFDEPQCWRKLALRLALVHVDGFQIAKPARSKGRRKSWTPQEDREFVQAIDAHSRTGKLPVKAAIKSAEKMSTWRWKVRGLSAETRYHEAKRRIIEEARISQLLRDLPLDPFQEIPSPHSEVDPKMPVGSVTVGRPKRKNV